MSDNKPNMNTVAAAVAVSNQGSGVTPPVQPAAKAPGPISKKKGSNILAAKQAARERIKKLAAEGGKAKLALARVFQQIVKDAYDGVADLEKLNKDTPNDAELYAIEAANAMALAGFEQATKATINKNKSYFTVAINAGRLTGVNAVEVMNDAYVVYTQDMATDKKRSMVEAFVSVARAQIKSPNQKLSKQEIKECCLPFTSDAQEETLIQAIVAMQKKAEKWSSAAQSSEADSVVDALKKWLAAQPAEDLAAHQATTKVPPAAKPIAPKASPAPATKANVGVAPTAKPATPPTTTALKPAATSQVGIPSPLGKPPVKNGAAVSTLSFLSPEQQAMLAALTQ